MKTPRWGAEDSASSRGRGSSQRLREATALGDSGGGGTGCRSATSVRRHDVHSLNLDTNVLVYAVSSDPEEAVKKERALALIESIDFGLSAQVMQEFYVVVTRKITRPLAPDDALALLEQFRSLPVVWTDYALLVAGIEASLKLGISYWDGSIIAAAERLGAATLYSENLSHGQRYGSISVVNPFLREASDGVHDTGGSTYS